MEFCFPAMTYCIEKYKTSLYYLILFTAAPPVDAQDFVPTAPLCAFFVQSPAVFGIRPSILPAGPGTSMYNLKFDSKNSK